jgi:hypothetical protein
VRRAVFQPRRGTRTVLRYKHKLRKNVAGNWHGYIASIASFYRIELNMHSMLLLQGPHPLYKLAPENVVPRSDSSCQELRGYHSDTANKRCDYDILYADQSSALGVLARDNLQLVSEDGERESLDLVFGYDPSSFSITLLTYGMCAPWFPVAR